MTIGPLNLSLAVAVVPFFIQFFNFFVGTVQAFVFTLLAIVYSRSVDRRRTLALLRKG